MLYETCSISKEVLFIWIFLWQYKKRWHLNTGDCLINRSDHMGRYDWIFNDGQCYVFYYNDMCLVLY